MNKLQQIGLSLSICFLGSLSLLTTGVQASSATAHQSSQNIQISHEPEEHTPTLHPVSHTHVTPATPATPSQPDPTLSPVSQHLPILTPVHNPEPAYYPEPQHSYQNYNNQQHYYQNYNNQQHSYQNHNNQQHYYQNVQHEQYYPENSIHHSQNIWYNANNNGILIPEDPSLIGHSLIGNKYQENYQPENYWGNHGQQQYSGLPQLIGNHYSSGLSHPIVIVIIAIVIPSTPPITPVWNTLE